MTYKHAGGPVKASHVFLKTLIKTHFGHAKLDPRPEELDLISTVFQKDGGSWVGVFEGSIEDITKLKQVVRVAAKTGRVTKAAVWLPKAAETKATEKQAGLLEPPPAMVEDIMAWLEQVLLANNLARTEEGLAHAEQTSGGQIAEYQSMLDMVLAVKNNPVNWKLYKPLSESGLIGFSSSITFKDFTKLDATKEATLREKVLKRVDVAETKVTEWLTRSQNEVSSYQSAVAELKAQITDPDAYLKRKKFKLNPTGWKYNAEYFKDMIQKRVRTTNQPLLENVQDRVTKLESKPDADPEHLQWAREIVSDLKDIIRDARDQYGTITVTTDELLPAGAAASWQSVSKILAVRPGDYATKEAMAELRKSVRHELTHYTQSYISTVTGHMDKALASPMRHIPRPGMPPKKIMTPDIKQDHTRERQTGTVTQELAQARQNLRQRGIPDSYVHSLDDVEFATDLADAIGLFKKMKSWHPDWTSDILRTAVKIFVFEIKKPNTDAEWEAAGGWKALSGVQPNKFFIALRLHAQGKWRRAVSELVNAVI